MKKLLSLFGVLMIASLILSSCGGGGSIESDAKRLADLECKGTQLMKKASSGDMSVLEESTKLATEAQELMKELENKYSSDSDKEKLREAYEKAKKNCE